WAFGINNSGFLNGPIHAVRLDPVVPSATPMDLLSSLPGMIAAFGLPRGQSESLTAPLQSCTNACQRGNSGAARNMLEAFENLVSAQRGKAMTTAQADALIGAAEQIRLLMS